MTANTFETAPPLTMGTTGLAAASSHVAMTKRFCEFALMTVLFTVVIATKSQQEALFGIQHLNTPLTSSQRWSNPTLKERVMGQLEPPSSRFRSRAPFFFIGRDSRGNCVVQDEHGLCGGLFVDCAEALRFALFENGNQPHTVIMVPGVFELDMNGKASAVHLLPLQGDAPRERRAAFCGLKGPCHLKVV